ncbi:aspartate aminotransferase family protein [Angustibacter sp. McL0619]|uniref:aspartate aminotransferase family protein n=1 Tax=Angustibacter sp. McL0619 TaxID=3415676 RepID=UPI003CE8488B
MSTVTVESLAPAAPPLDLDGAQRTHDLDRAHVFHSWSAQGALDPMVVTGAQGSWLWDGAGRPFLDFSSQLVNTNIGHQHPAVVRGIQEQAAKLCTIAPQHANDARSEAARLVIERSPGELSHVFFTNGGAEAIENAVRMARLHTGRRKVLTRYRSYHGHTQTAIHMTGDPRRWPNDTGAEGIVHFFGPYTYRSVFHAQTDDEECARALAHLEQVVQMEGPATIAAIVLETIPGTAGIMVPPPAYLAGVRDICDRYGICWIADEVMAGFGRSGAWFAVDHFSTADGGPVVPDLITFAKGVNSGYVPLGGVILGDAIYDTFRERPYPGGLTYSGHPLACAAAVATINAMTDEGIVQNAARIGAEVIGPRLAELAQAHPVIGEVRGLGVFWALELVRDRETREPLVPYNASGAAAAPMNALVAACKKRGLLPFVNMNRLHVVPPCNVTEGEARLGLDLLDEALGELESSLT